jgi:hypothetical protein
VARRVLLTFGNEASSRTMVITGTDRFGNVQSETLAVASGAGGTIGTNRDFLTVTSALPLGGGWTAAMTLGTSAIVSTPWFIRSLFASGQIGVLISIPTAGPTVALEVTWDDPEAAVGQFVPYGVSIEPTSAVPPLAVIAPVTSTICVPTTGLALASQTWAGITSTGGGADGRIDVPFFAWRMTQTAGSGTAVLYSIETLQTKIAY